MRNAQWFQNYSYHIALHAVVFIWGFTGILGKVIEIPYYAIVWYRMFFAALGLLAYFVLSANAVKVTPLKALRMLAVGFIVAAHWATFFQALKVSNVTVVLTTIASTSLFVAFLEPLFFKRRINVYEVLFGLVVIVGLYLIFSFESQYRLGVILALTSAFLAALFGTLNGLLIRESTASQITFYEMLGGLIGITLYTLLFENFAWTDFQPAPLDIVYLLVLGLLCTALAFVVSVEVMKKLSPFTVSISINMEPIYAIILALLFFGDSEKMTPGFYLGALLIMGTLIANGIIKRNLTNNRIASSAQ
tara:strand:- start:1007 stop:1921 length:915 start_codon:yes stop_codon:yes gene_type:complete